MFLGFPLDYQLPEFVRAAVSPFGHLLNWLEGPNKYRVLSKCLLLSLERVPWSLVISQGTLIRGAGRSWSVLVFVLNGQFLDIFPQDEDPVPFDGNPQPAYGFVNDANPNAPQGWQHESHGATQ